MLGAGISFAIAVIAGASYQYALIPAGWVGVGLSFALELTSFLKHCVRMMATLEAQMSCVQRIHYLTAATPMEAPLTSPPDRPLSPAWPTAGALSVRDLRLRYNKLVDLGTTAADGAASASTTTSGPEVLKGALAATATTVASPATCAVPALWWLAGVSFEVQPGDKIGIVGRTG